MKIKTSEEMKVITDNIIGDNPNNWKYIKALGIVIFEIIKISSMLLLKKIKGKINN